MHNHHSTTDLDQERGSRILELPLEHIGNERFGAWLSGNGDRKILIAMPDSELESRRSQSPRPDKSPFAASATQTRLPGGLPQWPETKKPTSCEVGSLCLRFTELGRVLLADPNLEFDWD